MKFAIVFLGLVAVALARPAADDSQTQILRLDNDVGPEGYKFALETSDGSNRQEQGELKNAGSEDASIAVRGSYSFVAPDGQTYTVNFVADENGYQPEGAHIPKAL